MMPNATNLTALLLLCVPAPAIAGEILPTHARQPSAIIFERSDHGGRNSAARARVTHETAVDWCENWRPGDPLAACVKDVMESEDGRVYEVRADCHSGEMTSHHGDRYVYDGLWTVADAEMWRGWARFTHIESGETVGTSNAAGGITLAAQWRTLCPYGAPFDRQPLKLIVTGEDSSLNREVAGHNGSGMMIDYDMGTISYSAPKESLDGVVPVGALLFRGTIIMNGPVEGMAFTFRKGCEPAPYHVEGYFPSDSDKLVLTGRSPVREGCEVVGYTERSPNARLVIDLPHH